MNPTTPDVDADCLVTDQVTDATGATTSTPLPACNDPNASRPCWSASSMSTCGGALGLFITRAEDPPAGTATNVSCQICPPGEHLSGCP